MRHKRLFSHVYLSSSSVDVYPRSGASRTTKRRVGASARCRISERPKRSPRSRERRDGGGDERERDADDQVAGRRGLDASHRVALGEALVHVVPCCAITQSAGTRGTRAEIRLPLLGGAVG